MYNIWFERSVPEQYVPMFEDVANGISPGDQYAQNPFHQVDIADGIMAGGVTYDGEFMDKAPRFAASESVMIKLMLQPPPNAELPSVTRRMVQPSPPPNKPSR